MKTRPARYRVGLDRLAFMKSTTPACNRFGLQPHHLAIAQVIMPMQAPHSALADSVNVVSTACRSNASG
jgi:hypothetical protein